ncbi:MAG: hypothetical protein FJX67_06405 [Alphaproteobacteria bacterium]|nr:hypothetical protein [Alphaproteobacteria bacterium]
MIGGTIITLVLALVLLAGPASGEPGDRKGADPGPKAHVDRVHPRSDGATIARVQRNLAALGYDVGRATGRMNRKTRAAIRAFETAHGHSPTGEATRALDEVLVYEVETGRERGTVAAAPIERHGDGTAFAVNSDGYVVTAAHVVDRCREVRAVDATTFAIVAVDAKADLAVLRAPVRFDAVASFREGPALRIGKDAIVIGYPLQHVLAAEASVTRGNVSALSGYRDDPGELTVTAPVQPGNSGGPLLDSAANVIGVITSTIGDLRIARHTGWVPQNANFAAKAAKVRALLDANGVGYQRRSSSGALSTADVAEAAVRFTLRLECWN